MADVDLGDLTPEEREAVTQYLLAENSGGILRILKRCLHCRSWMLVSEPRIDHLDCKEHRPLLELLNSPWEHNKLISRHAYHLMVERFISETDPPKAGLNGVLGLFDDGNFPSIPVLPPDEAQS